MSHATLLSSNQPQAL